MFRVFIFIFFIISIVNGATLSKEPLENSLIVYNSNIALVYEKRELSVKKDDKYLVYSGVASRIVTDSINIKLPESVKLFSQQYRYDKLTLPKLLEAHIGKIVEVLGEKVTLLAYDHSKCLVKINEGTIVSVDTKDVTFQKIPKELITKPSLVWNIESYNNLKENMELEYLINGISWKSDYVLNIDQKSANLVGWISLNNRSGKAFKNTELNLLAGDINRVEKVVPEYIRAKTDMLYTESNSVQHQPYEGYHFYSVPFKVNLANNENTQIKFIEKNDLDFERDYREVVSNPAYINGEKKHDVSQYVTIKSLDIPLPEGVVRSYSKHYAKSVLLGEETIKHTPKNTPVTIRLGKNFDIKVVESIVKRDDDQKYYEATVNYKVLNNSNKKKIVHLLVPFNKHDKSSIKTSQTYKYTKGNMLEFSISVEANSSESFDVEFRSKR